MIITGQPWGRVTVTFQRECNGKKLRLRSGQNVFPIVSVCSGENLQSCLFPLDICLQRLAQDFGDIVCEGAKLFY